MTYSGPREVALTELLKGLPVTGTPTLYRSLLEASVTLPGVDHGVGSFAPLANDGLLLILTHREFAALTPLEPTITFRDVAFRDVLRYVRNERMRGIVLNPGHSHFRVSAFAIDLLADGELPFSDEAALAVDTLKGCAPYEEYFSPEVRERLRAAAAATSLEELRLGRLGYEWQGDIPCVFYSPYPSPQFEVLVAGIFPGSSWPVRSRSLTEMAPSVNPLYQVQRMLKFEEGEGDVIMFPADIPLRFGPYEGGIPDGLWHDLERAAPSVGLTELYALTVQFGDLPPQVALAYRPFPHDDFAERYRELHHAHGMGAVNVPLISAWQVGDRLLGEGAVTVYRQK